MAWRELDAGGFFLTANPANSFFYLITGMHGLHIVGGLVGLGRTTRKSLGRRQRRRPASLSVELCAMYWHFLLFVWLAVVRSSGRLGRRFHRYLPPVADLGRDRADGRDDSVACRQTAPRPDGLQGIAADWSSDQRAFKNVSWGKAMMWIFLLSRHLHLRLLPAVLHDGAHVDAGAVAQSERGVQPAYRRGKRSAAPDRHHDFRPYLEQRHDGARRQLRLPPRSPQGRALPAADGRARRDLRRHAGVRVDEADLGRRAALGQSVGRGRSSARPSS